ncbi:hypothetical protein [Erysipelothrix aquatica]|nr:hypothetical protein [Erysipelothrix aquatica]
MNKKKDTIWDVNSTRSVVLQKTSFGKTDFEVRPEFDCVFGEEIN